MKELPGICGAHAIITPACVSARGEDGAVEEALVRVRRELEACMPGWRGKGATFHVAMTVEPPPAKAPDG